MATGSTRAIVAALFANAGIAVAKFIGFAFTGASSMLAEAIHSVADTGNQALLLHGGRRSRRGETPDHPFGYGRARYFWSFIVALVLFSLGGLFSLYEGWHKLGDLDHEPTNLWWAVGILVIAIVLETGSFRVAIRESRAVKGAASWWQFIRHARSPELPVVLLEDLGALLGLVLALTGVTLTALTGDSHWDAYATLGIGALLVVIAIVLVVEMKGLLLGESAVAADRDEIAAALVSTPGVERVIHMRTQHIGPEEILVGAKLQLSDGLDTDGVATVLNLAEDAVRRAEPMVTIMYLEPDLFDPTRDG